MGDYISREAAMPDGFCVGVRCQDCPFCDDSIKGGCKVARFIDAIPAADVVEVVRCKDCIHRDPEDRKCDCGGQERQGCPLPVRGSYFCAHGKRKDGGQDDV